VSAPLPTIGCNHDEDHNPEGPTSSVVGLHLPARGPQDARPRARPGPPRL